LIAVATLPTRDDHPRKAMIAPNRPVAAPCARCENHRFG
jgi:hypothetical protein